MSIACKFGGTSLACSANILKCCEIIRAKDDRKYIVVSAPGKRDSTAKKVTDLLLLCYKHRFDSTVFDAYYTEIRNIFSEIAAINKDFPIEKELGTLYAQIKNSEANLDFVLSRGEYLNARIIAAYLKFSFLDATEFIRFKDGELDLNATIEAAKKLSKKEYVVIPGFYGLDEHGHIKTFSRGGSDITGSIVARIFACELYENWTDVDGIHVCDPRVIPNSKKVEQVSFRELREMSYMGASVLHAETLLPLYDAPIPLEIKNSFFPALNGTKILKKRTEVSQKETITCITGKNDYTCIQISKTMLDKQLGFVKKVTSIFEEYHINISHTHSGLDNLCFFVEHSQYTQISFKNFLKELEMRIHADKIKGYEKIALLAVIGHNLAGKIGIISRIFTALDEKKISVKTVYQSISECNIIIGIEEDKLQEGIKAIYHKLID